MDEINRKKINELYSKSLESKDAMGELIVLCHKNFGGIARNCMYKYGLNDPDIFEDLLSEIAIRIMGVCQRKVEFTADFVSYVTGIYKNTPKEIADKRYRIIRGEGSTFDEFDDKTNENEMEGDINRLYKYNSLENLSVESVEDSYTKNNFNSERQKKGAEFFSLLCNTKIIPHQVVAFCYSVIIPGSIQIDIENDMEISNCLDAAMEKTYSKYLENNAMEDSDLAGIFTEDIKIDYDFRIENFMFSFVYRPFLTSFLKSLASEDKKKREFCKKLFFALDEFCDDATLATRGNGVSIKASKYLMDKDTINTLSEKTELMINKHLRSIHKFFWGEEYRNNLNKGYCDLRSGLNIENEGEAIFSETFSKPFKGEPKEGVDYLESNISNYTKRVRIKLMAQIVETNKDIEISKKAKITLDKYLSNVR